MDSRILFSRIVRDLKPQNTTSNFPHLCRLICSKYIRALAVDPFWKYRVWNLRLHATKARIIAVTRNETSDGQTSLEKTAIPITTVAFHELKKMSFWEPNIYGKNISTAHADLKMKTVKRAKSIHLFFSYCQRAQPRLPFKRNMRLNVIKHCSIDKDFFPINFIINNKIKT